jgi:hypothetical protein
VQLKIDALKEAAAWPGAGRRTPVVLASQLMAAELYQEGHPPARLYAGRGPGQRRPQDGRLARPGQADPGLTEHAPALDTASL